MIVNVILRPESGPQLTIRQLGQYVQYFVLLYPVINWVTIKF